MPRERELFRPEQSKLSVKGVVKGNLETESFKATKQEIYVVENLNEPLLGRPAIDALNLVKGVQAIQYDQSSAIEEAKTTYPKLFRPGRIKR